MVKQDDSKNEGGLKPTGLRISLEKIVEWMEFQPETVSSYLNVTTKDIVMVSEEAINAIEEGEEIDLATGEPLDDVRAALSGKDHIPLPDRFEINEYRMKERFARSVVDEAASSELLNTLRGSGAFRYFKDTVHRLSLAENWYEFRDLAYKEIAIAWCKEHDIEYLS